MKKYHVAMPFYATAFIKVEAENEEEAIEKAEREIGYPTLCHQCSHDVEMGEPNYEVEADAVEIEK